MMGEAQSCDSTIKTKKERLAEKVMNLQKQLSELKEDSPSQIKDRVITDLEEELQQLFAQYNNIPESLFKRFYGTRH
jgi:hypothetical protein